MTENKKNAEQIIKNAIILTINQNGDIFQNGSLVVNGDKIEYIGETDEVLKKFDSGNIIDASGKILMPGLINAHTHASMTVFRGIADDIELADWLHKYIFPAESKYVTPEIVEFGSKLAIIEMLNGGTTCFNDMYYFQDITAKIASDIGIRAIVSESIIDFKVANSDTPDDCIEYVRDMVSKYKNNPLVDVGMAAHSTYTCSPELLVKAKKFADDYNLNFHIHLSESQWEVNTVKEKYGLNPVQHLEKLGILSENVIAAHSVWLDDKDIEVFVKRKVGVAHNPECNMKISSGVAPIPKYLKAGIKVGLGTDGTASNNNLNMFQEMKTMALLHKIHNMSPTIISAEDVVRSATIGSAKVLRKDKEIGSLEVGKKADIIFIDTNFANITPYYNIYSAIVYSMLGNEITDVMINGKFVKRNNKVLTINEEEIKQKVRELAKKLAVVFK